MHHFVSCSSSSPWASFHVRTWFLRVQRASHTHTEHQLLPPNIRSVARIRGAHLQGLAVPLLKGSQDVSIPGNRVMLTILYKTLLFPWLGYFLSINSLPWNRWVRERELCWFDPSARFQSLAHGGPDLRPLPLPTPFSGTEVAHCHVSVTSRGPSEHRFAT